jgi:uncharacterized membrane protein HdeD (DUF308 family)
MPRRWRQPLQAALVTLACLLIAAHFLRADARLVAVLSAAVPCLLAVRRSWAPRVVQLVLLAATVEWIRTAIVLVHDRRAAGAPWRRMVTILLAVAGVTLWAALSAPRASRVSTLPTR